jgi:kynurenine formamidase
VLCFPLNLVGADASPVRAVALELDNESKEPSL